MERAVIAGIDLSTSAIDVVLLDEDSDAATWRRVPLVGNDAFDRARDVKGAMWQFGSDIWDDVLAIGIEDPRGYGAGSLYRIQGAILSCLPARTLVHPWIPSAWRKQVGLPGNASKHDVILYAETALGAPLFMLDGTGWPQDAYDAFCIALATRQRLELGAAA